jgi:hypothetical protein
MPKVVQIALDKEEYILPTEVVLSMGDSNYGLNFDQGTKNEIQHHS